MFSIRTKLFDILQIVVFYKITSIKHDRSEIK